MRIRVVPSAAVLALASTLGLVDPAGAQDNFGKANTPQTPSVIIAPSLQPAPPPVVVQPSPPAVVIPPSPAPAAPVIVQPAPPGTVVVQPAPAPVVVSAVPMEAEDI
jgi:hypothetical protein